MDEVNVRGPQVRFAVVVVGGRISEEDFLCSYRTREEAEAHADELNETCRMAGFTARAEVREVSSW